MYLLLAEWCSFSSVWNCFSRKQAYEPAVTAIVEKDTTLDARSHAINIAIHHSTWLKKKKKKKMMTKITTRERKRKEMTPMENMNKTCVKQTYSFVRVFGPIIGDVLSLQRLKSNPRLQTIIKTLRGNSIIVTALGQSQKKGEVRLGQPRYVPVSDGCDEYEFVTVPLVPKSDFKDAWTDRKSVV